MTPLTSIILGIGFAAMAAISAVFTGFAAKNGKITAAFIITAIICGGLSYPLITNGWEDIKKPITPTTTPQTKPEIPEIISP